MTFIFSLFRPGLQAITLATLLLAHLVANAQCGGTPSPCEFAHYPLITGPNEAGGLNNPTTATNLVFSAQGMNTSQNTGTWEAPDNTTFHNPQFSISLTCSPIGPGQNPDGGGSVLVQKGTTNNPGSNVAFSLWWVGNPAVPNADRFVLGWGDIENDIIVSADQFPAGQTYCVTATYDGINYSLYVDGVPQGTLPGPAPDYGTGEPWTIGVSQPAARNIGFGRRFNGWISDVRFFDCGLPMTTIQDYCGADLATITGTLTDCSGNPLPGIPVVANGGGNSYQTTTDALGVYTMSVLPGVNYGVEPFSWITPLSDYEDCGGNNIGPTNTGGTTSCNSYTVDFQLGEACVVDVAIVGDVPPCPTESVTYCVTYTNTGTVDVLPGSVFSFDPDPGMTVTGVTIQGSSQPFVLVAGPAPDYDVTLGQDCGEITPNTGCTEVLYNRNTPQSAQNANQSPYDDRNVKRIQYLYRVSELQALGLVAGDISSIGFLRSTISNNASNTYVDFTIRLRCVGQNALTNAFVGGPYETVFGPQNVTLPGNDPALVDTWTQHNFDQLFYWDGATNILVDICYNNDVAEDDNHIWTYNPGYRAFTWDDQGCNDNFGGGNNRLPLTQFGLCNPTFPFSPGESATICWDVDVNTQSNPYVTNATVANIDPTGSQGLCGGNQVTSGGSLQENGSCVPLDPNDISVSPLGCGPNNVMKAERLYYTIRFQNIGTGPAQNVVILNDLDTDLDLSTLAVTTSSQPISRVQVVNGELQFYFDNIYLPYASVDPEGSQGFVRYSVVPQSGLAEGTSILNSADIYFDAQPPITTNQVTTTIVSDATPQPNFTSAHSTSDFNLVYDFTYTGSLVTGDVITWDFGSTATPSTSTDINPQGISFSVEGKPNVMVTVDRFGCTASYSADVVVEDLRCPECRTGEISICKDLGNGVFDEMCIDPANTSAYTARGWTVGQCTNPAYVYMCKGGPGGIEECVAVGDAPTYLANGYALETCGIFNRQDVSMLSEEVATDTPLALKLYPNPNNGQFTLEIDRDSEVSVYNLMGESVRATKRYPAGRHQMTLDQASGIYLVIVRSGDEAQLQKIMVK